MKKNRISFTAWALFLVLLPFNETLLAQDKEIEEIPTRFGFALSYGSSFHPDNDIGFIMADYLVMFDYDKIWPHSAPDNLRFKLEFSLGSTTTPDHWTMASAGMMALCYLDFIESAAIRPYIEAGIGVIYTGFRVEGQGSHLNFNPKAGLGLEFPLHQKSLFTSLRWDHLSNAGLSPDNVSVDSVVLMFGAYF